jgi:hypothetical protein
MDAIVQLSLRRRPVFSARVQRVEPDGVAYRHVERKTAIPQKFYDVPQVSPGLAHKWLAHQVSRIHVDVLVFAGALTHKHKVNVAVAIAANATAVLYDHLGSRKTTAGKFFATPVLTIALNHFLGNIHKIPVFFW